MIVTIADERLKQFFSRQKVGAFDALKQSPKLTTNPDKNIKQSDGMQNLSSKKNINILLEPLAIQEQPVSKSLANQQQLVSKPLADSKQIVSNTLAKPLANIEEIQFADLRNFSKKERDLLLLIFLQCQAACSLISPPISTEEIRNTLNISAERVRNLVFRISKKGGIKVTQHKSGQSAYRVFELPKSLYQWMVEKHSPANDPLAKPLANSSYSSNIINTTTVLPEEWEKIDISSLTGIGFSRTQLIQLFEKQLNTSEAVQESIYHFSFGLENNAKVKAYGEPLNVLMGVLRKGGVWFEKNYISPKEKALEELLKLKKQETERIQFLEKELLEQEYKNWISQLSLENKDKILDSFPKTNLISKILADKANEGYLLQYFKNHVYNKNNP